MVTTINTKDFHKAGIKSMPKTMAQYDADLKALQQHHVSAHPLGIPFAAAEGLSTYWYEVTGALGGQLLSSSFAPLFTSSTSPGYKAMTWMVNAYKSGLVPRQNINMTDSDEMQNQMAHHRVTTLFSDYSGQVGTIYDVPSASTVLGQVQYTETPGAHGPGPNLDNPDGIGIPMTAKHAGAAVEFMKWFDSSVNQARWSGLNGSKDVIVGFPLPMRLSSLQLLAKSNKVAQAQELIYLLQHRSRPVFPAGAPPWYPQFSAAVNTNIHSAALGSESVSQAIKAIANTVQQLQH
jgi:multiple sugar transport system substrate-binding protein